ncbi:MAG: hypothetical protein ACRCXC_09940 [Legionella sp.]
MSVSDEEARRKTTSDAAQEQIDANTKKRKREQADEDSRYLAERDAKREAAHAGVVDELKNRHKIKDPHTGKDTTTWDQVLDEADRLLNPKTNTTVNWTSMMLELLASFKMLFTAIKVSREQLMGKASLPVKHFLAEKVWHKTIDFLLDKIKGHPELELDPLHHNVSLDKNGKLVIAPLKDTKGNDLKDPLGPDGAPIADDARRLNASFKVLTKMWLLENGFREQQGNPGSYVFHRPTKNGAVPIVDGKPLKEGEPLTSKLFDDINADHTTSLANFLRTNVGLEYKSDYVSQTTP